VKAPAIVPVLVVAGAGLLTKSLLLLSRVDMGFTSDDLLFVRPIIPPTKYADPQHVRDLMDRLVNRVKTLPGVTSASAVSHLPFSLTGGIDMSYTAEGQDRRAAAVNPLLSYIPTQPTYFRTMGLPLRKGREFSIQDRDGSSLVVIVSEAVARRTWPGADPIGKRLKQGPPEVPGPWRSVVGVAADAFQAGYAVQIDEMFGGGEPKLHHRDQTVAAGKGPGLLAERR